MGHYLRGFIASSTQANRCVLLEAVRQLSEQPIVGTVLPLLDSTSEPCNLTILIALFRLV